MAGKFIEIINLTKPGNFPEKNSNEKLAKNLTIK
jgi:hypothetical protein